MYMYIYIYKVKEVSSKPPFLRTPETSAKPYIYIYMGKL